MKVLKADFYGRKTLVVAKNLNNKLLWNGELYIVDKDDDIKKLLEVNESKCGKIVKSKRIGIDYAKEAKDFLYRFYYNDNPYVSKKDKKKLIKL